MSRKKRHAQPVAPSRPGPVRVTTKIQKTLNPVVSGIDLRQRVHEVLAVQRQAVQARRGSFRAAQNPRSRNQVPFGGSGDQHVDAWSRRLARELSRDLDRNADTFRVVMDAFQAAIAGDGVRYRPTSPDREWNQRAASLLDQRMKALRGGIDSREMRNGYRIISDFVRSTGVDGECGLIKLTDGRVQVIESEQVTNGGRINANDVDGIQTDDAGKVIAYNVAPYGPGGGIDHAQATPYDAEQVIWTAIRSRFSQTRGMPILIAALEDWERIDSYRESEIIAAEQGSQVYGAIEHQYGDMGSSQAFTPDGSDPSQVIRGGFTGDTNVDWQPTSAGSILDLPNGMKYVPINPARPNKDCAPFLIEMLRHFCGNVGLPYEFVYNDLRGLSWSINRALVQLARDRIAVWQSQVFGPSISELYTWQLAYLIQSGELKPVDGWDSHELCWPQISWPDEGKEYEAQALGLQRGLTSRHRIHGPAWQILMRERLEELDFASELCADHNKRYPDMPVEPWYFLGFSPDDAPAPLSDVGPASAPPAFNPGKSGRQATEAMRLAASAIQATANRPAMPPPPSKTVQRLIRDKKTGTIQGIETERA